MVTRGRGGGGRVVIPYIEAYCSWLINGAAGYIGYGFRGAHSIQSPFLLMYMLQVNSLFSLKLFNLGHGLLPRLILNFLSPILNYS